MALDYYQIYEESRSIHTVFWDVTICDPELVDQIFSVFFFPWLSTL
jgi:hypothetical protein